MEHALLVIIQAGGCVLQHGETIAIFGFKRSQCLASGGSLLFRGDQRPISARAPLQVLYNAPRFQIFNEIRFLGCRWNVRKLSAMVIQNRFQTFTSCLDFALWGDAKGLVFKDALNLWLDPEVTS